MKGLRMKKVYSLIFVIFMCLAIASCGENNPNGSRAGGTEPSLPSNYPDVIATATNQGNPKGIPDETAGDASAQSDPGSQNGTGKEDGAVKNNGSGIPSREDSDKGGKTPEQTPEQTPVPFDSGEEKTPEQTPVSSGGTDVALTAAQIQRRLSDLKNLHLSVENRMRALYYVVMPQKREQPELRQKETEFLNWSLSDFIDLSGGELYSDPLAAYQTILSQIARIYNFEYDDGVSYETVTIASGDKTFQAALPVGQTAKYNMTVTSSLGNRYEEGTFEEVFLNYDRNGVYKENKKLTDPKELFLSSGYSKIEIKNSAKKKRIVVIHNLKDLRFIAYLSQNFGSVTAINVDAQKEGKVTEMIRSDSDFDLVISLLDLSHAYAALNSGADIQNGAVKADGTTARPVRIGNGETGSVLGKADILPMVTNTVGFKEDLEKEGIQLLCVSPPYKIIPGHSVLPYGLIDYTNQNREEYLAGLQKNGVPYIDGAQVLKNRGVPETDWFYDTDHHWRDTAAWQVYREIISYMKNTLKWDVDPGGRNTDLNQFHVETYPGYFYGSQAREITLHYAQIDDFTILSPKFDTFFEFTVNQNKRQDTKTGTYREVLIAQRFLDEPSDTFRNRYAAYIGGDNPNNIIKNNNGYSDKRVLIIEDSFSLPVDCFMSLNFKELQTIDLRSFRQSATSYAIGEKFDLVILLQNPSCFYEFPKMYKFK